MDTNQLPRKVESIVSLWRRSGWEPTIERDERNGRIFYWIRAERYPGTLASSSVSTSVYVGRSARGRVGRSYYDSIGFHKEWTGWDGVRMAAGMGPVIR